jgi:multiple sugar transport system ATP-binding protein
MRLELPRVLRARETTVVYVTQDYKEAMALGDRIAVLVDGVMEQIGTPRDIYQTPANSRIARLFGDPPINLLPVEPVAGSQGAQIRVASTEIRLASHPARPIEGCVLGLRPEDVSVGFEQRPGAMPVEIDAVTPLNDREVMLLRARDGTEIFASAPQGSMEGNSRGRRDAWAMLDLAQAHFFATATGARV